MRRALRHCAVLALFVCALATAAHGQTPGPGLRGLPERPIPAGAGRIAGRVIHAQSGAPVAATQVILLALDAQGQPSWRTATSDARGRYAFDGIATSGLTYQLGALHAGVPFSGARLTFESGALQIRADDLLVREPRPAAPGDLALDAMRVVLDVDAAAMRVREIHELRAGGEIPLLGTAQSPLLRIPLPNEAVDMRARSSDASLELRPTPTPGAAGAIGAAGESLAIIGALAPGELRVELEYRLPAPASAGGATGPARFARRLPLRIPLLEIYLVDTGDLAPRSKLLHQRRPARDGATNYLRLEAFEVAPGEEVALTLDRLPPRSAAAQGVARAAAGALALGALAVLLAPLARPGRRAQSGAGAATGAGARTAAAAAREEREALYAAIGDLDHDLETGKLSAADHAELRGELRARAIHLLREERAGGDGNGAQAADSESRAAEGAAEGAEAAAVTDAPPRGEARAVQRCDACGFEAAQAHRFCARCGNALETAEPNSKTAAAENAAPNTETKTAAEDATPNATASGGVR